MGEVIVDLPSKSDIKKLLKGLNKVTCTDYAIITGAKFDKAWAKNRYLSKNAYFKIDNRNIYFSTAKEDSLYGDEIGIMPTIYLPEEIDNGSNLETINFGRYPQFVTSKDNRIILEDLYQKGMLAKTGRKYDDNIEYFYNGHYYIRMDLRSYRQLLLFSDRRLYSGDEDVWIEVSPVTWYIDNKKNQLLSRHILRGCEVKMDSGRSIYDKYFALTAFEIGFFQSDNVQNIENSNIQQQIIRSNVSIARYYGSTEKFKIDDDVRENSKYYFHDTTELSKALNIFDSYFAISEPDGKLIKISFCISHDVPYEEMNQTVYRAGVVPAINYDFIKNSSFIKSENEETIDILYGEFPQDEVDEITSSHLDSAFRDGYIKKTGKVYHLPVFADKMASFEEYEYEGKKYINYKYHLSGSWIGVNSIEWTVDKKNNIATAKKILLGNIPITLKKRSEPKFENTSLYDYLNTYFINEIIPINSKIINKNEKVAQVIDNNPIVQMIMKKNDLNINDVEINNENKLVLRR